MELNIIKEEELSIINPNRELSNMSVDEYAKLYSLYRKLFVKFMIKKLNLKNYDERIKDSGLNFCVTKKETMDVYQSYSSEYLDYFYLRNNIYIEKLDYNEINFLREKFNSNNFDLDEESKNMIENSYKKVIFEDALKNGKECITFWGSSSYYMAENNSLIIGIRYNEFSKNGLTDYEWDELHTRQKKFLDALTKEMKENFKKIINIPLYIFKYNEFSLDYGER